MKTLLCMTILLGSATATAIGLTGNDLVLLRMLMRQEMTAEVQAGAASTDPATRSRLAPLETALVEIPRVHDFYALMIDEKEHPRTRFNAARALAYFGDARSTEFLASVVHGQWRSFTRCVEQSQAALCLLYLGYDLSDDLAFSERRPCVYPELDVFLEEPEQPISASSPYTQEQLDAAIALYLAHDYHVAVRGPLCVPKVEQEALAEVLRDVAEHARTDITRVPFGNQVYEWEQFKGQMVAGDLLYHFCTDDDAWEAQEGREGYALVRGGLVRAVIVTATNRPQTGMLVFDDFDDPLNFGWHILNNDPTHWSLGKVPGTLTITTQAGTFVRSRQDYRNVFLIDCPAAAGQDFQVTTCLVSFRPVGPWNQAGLLLWNSPDHYLKLNYEYGEGPPGRLEFPRPVHTVGLEIDGAPSFVWYDAEQAPEKVWLRIVKRADVCELFSSTDGESFTPLTALVPEVGPADHRAFWDDAEVKYIGLYAENGSAASAPSVDASFDFFEVEVLPTAED